MESVLLIDSFHHLDSLKTRLVLPCVSLFVMVLNQNCIFNSPVLAIQVMDIIYDL